MPTDTEQQKVETKDRAPIVDTIQRLTFAVDGGLFKPDAIVGAKSWDIYDEMQRRDPRIARGLGFLKDFMLAGGQEAVAEDEDAETEKRAEFCRWNMEHINGAWSKVPRQIMAALENGMSINEMIFARVEEGEDYAGLVYLKDFKDKHPRFFHFDQDDFGNLKPDGLVQFWQMANEIRHDTSKFVIYSHDSVFGNLYGRPLLQPIYEAYFRRQVLPRQIAVSIEKSALGVIVVKVPKGTSAADKTALLNDLKKMHGSCEYVLEEGDEQELMPFNAEGLRFAKDWLDRDDNEISVGLTIPVMMFSNNQTGSYARSASDLDAAMVGWRREQAVVDDVITDQIFRRLCDFNFGPGPVPRHRMKPVEAGGLDSFVKRYQALAAAGVKPAPEVVARDMGIDPNELEEKPVPQPFGGQPTDGKPEDGMPRPGDKRFSEGDPEAFYRPQREPRTAGERRLNLSEMRSASKEAVGRAALEMARAVDLDRKAKLASLRLEAGEAERPLASTRSQT